CYSIHRGLIIPCFEAVLMTFLVFLDSQVQRDSPFVNNVTLNTQAIIIHATQTRCSRLSNG
ncbi:MAG: hypothetical protein SAJ37_05655, partial [Oscillatoria sp. PMC 1068.18]|nr:hypothetical protein [Oscillatoria sp. PMC 1068.18]